MPFNIWCDGCGELVGKGVRFNAEKQQIGTYLSSKIWSFGMHHHCGCRIEIVTDPKTAQYIVKNGAKQKVRTFATVAAGKPTDKGRPRTMLAVPRGAMSLDRVR